MKIVEKLRKKVKEKSLPLFLAFLVLVSFSFLLANEMPSSHEADYQMLHEMRDFEAKRIKETKRLEDEIVQNRKILEELKAIEGVRHAGKIEPELAFCFAIALCIVLIIVLFAKRKDERMNEQSRWENYPISIYKVKEGSFKKQLTGDRK